MKSIINTFIQKRSVFYLLFAMLISCNFLFSQQVTSNPARHITVIGSAEMSIIPDQVELSIQINTSRSEHEKVEKQLLTICKKHGIPESQLNFKNSLGHNDWYYWYWWWYYRHSSQVQQTYKLKISSNIDFLAFVQDLNHSWVRNITIASTTHKDLTEYRKEVKKEAMRMAKEKATYLLEAVDEKLGSIVSVDEINADVKNDKNPNGHPYPYYYWHWDNPYYLNGGGGNSQMSSNSVMSSGGSSRGGGEGSDDSGIAGLSSIKLRYEVKVVFEIR